MYAQLGNIMFDGLKGFTEKSEAYATVFSEHARIQGKPRLQRTGEALTDLSVGVTLHSSFCNPEAELDALQQSRRNGEVLPLILGNGAYAGEFVITNLDVETRHSDPQGNLISVGVSLKLKESYTTDRLQKRTMLAKQSAFATTVGGSTPIRLVVPPKPTIGLQAMNQVKTAQVESSAIARFVARGSLLTAEWDSLTNRTAGSLANIQAAMTGLRSDIVDPLLTAYTTGLPTAIGAVETAVRNFQAGLPWVDINDAIAFSNALGASVSGLLTASTGLAQAIATRRI